MRRVYLLTGVWSRTPRIRARKASSRRGSVRIDSVRPLNRAEKVYVVNMALRCSYGTHLHVGSAAGTEETITLRHLRLLLVDIGRGCF